MEPVGPVNWVRLGPVERKGLDAMGSERLGTLGRTREEEGTDAVSISATEKVSVMAGSVTAGPVTALGNVTAALRMSKRLSASAEALARTEMVVVVVRRVEMVRVRVVLTGM